jgi:hypothetical protein
MKTINIKGKEYIPVVERVKEFHRLYPNGSIETEVISNDASRVIVKATVRPFKLYLNRSEEMALADHIFKGHSQAEWGKGMMGAVALEVAETSAVGRALGFAGIGIDTGIASADEMRKVGEDVPF